MKKILLLIICCLALTCTSSYAQQDARFSQYMFNNLGFNPAYAGTGDGLALAAIYRKQWVNIDGAPQTANLSAHTKLVEDGKVGLGLNLQFDEIGLTNAYSGFGSYSYCIKTGRGSDDAMFNIGVSAGATLMQKDLSKAQGNGLIDPTIDPIFNSGEDMSKILPNFGFGLYYFLPNKYYVGISAPRLLTNNFREKDPEIAKVAHEFRHYYVTAGMVFGDEIKLRPSILLKMVPGNAPLQLDINLMALFKDTIWLGASFRADQGTNPESLDFIAALQLENGMKIGYAYDLTLSDLSDYTSGSHEIMLAYDVKRQSGRIKSPRFF
ncbi:MAG: type IX secretion system membrane protein PorP/SprF [Chitinophagales bacterium]